MLQQHTTAIVLRRINYGEADRIITVLTPDHGKLALMAKGVRKSTSKLAGGIELMSESEVSFIKGKGDIDTLVSTKLIRHFAFITENLDRLTVASNFLKKLDKVTEIDPHSEYYQLAIDTMLLLNTPAISVYLAQAWSTIRLLFILGEVPNLQHDTEGEPFREDAMYTVDFESSSFMSDPRGAVEPNLIKFIRLLVTHPGSAAASVKDSAVLAEKAAKIIDLIYTYHRPV